MSKRKTTRHPIESFGPEMMTALVNGGRQSLELKFPSYKVAIQFQQRIYMLRQEMKRTGHELYHIAAKATTSIKWGEAAGYPKTEDRITSKNVHMPVDTNVPATMLIYPKDSQFGDVLKAAGISIAEIKRNEDLLTPSIAPDIDHLSNDGGSQTIEQLFRDLPSDKK